jgi:DNA-binding MarR family transcriptional regulator/ribosomal protein S18 acetylase RimI-like enzyme
MHSDQIGQVRRFNRVVTRRIGALEDSYLSRGRPLGEARLIFEAGLADSVDVRSLRQRLGLDSGYLSRLLRSLEGQGVVKVRRKAADGRVRQVILTQKGRAEFETYNVLSDELAQSFLSSLDPTQRGRLVAAMAEVERLMRSSMVEIAAEPPESADAQWCLEQYFAELDARFEGGFDVSLGNPDGAADMTPPNGVIVVARLDGEPVGCGVLKQLDAGIGEVKRVWVSPSARGMGVASKLMQKLEQLGRERGYRLLRLDTNKALTEAHALYSKLGYRDTERYNDNPYAHRWFEKLL